MIKLITTIQSFTDVITNSSSSVFIMHEDDAHYYNCLDNTNGCITINPLNLEWIKQSWLEEWELIFDYFNLDKNIISKQIINDYFSYWETPSKDTWETWVENNKDLLESELSDKYLVEIEDHFENAYEVTEQAYGDAIFSESRH